MKANKEQRIPTISVIGGVGQGKSSIIEALWNTSIKVESSGNSIYKVNDNIPGRGIMTFNVKELPPVIYSLQKEWLKNESNLNELALSDVILYIVPASSFGYKQEVAFLRNLLQLDCYHNQHIVICLSKADYLLIDEESKGIGIDSITRLMQINCTLYEAFEKYVTRESFSCDSIIPVSIPLNWNYDVIKEKLWEGIIEKITNPKPTSIDGIKRRTRASMGRCQGGFCTPYMVEILAREMGVDVTEITKSGKGSYINVGRTEKGLD